MRFKPEMYKSRSTGVDSGGSQRFSAGAGAGPGVIFKQSGFKILMVICTVRKL